MSFVQEFSHWSCCLKAFGNATFSCEQSYFKEKHSWFLGERNDKIAIFPQANGYRHNSWEIKLKKIYVKGMSSGSNVILESDWR